MSEQIEIAFDELADRHASEILNLEDMGTTGLSDFVAFGGPEMYYDRLKLCAAVIRRRLGDGAVVLFYKLCEKITPNDTKEVLKRWSQDRCRAGALAEDWERTKEMAQRWAIEIREAWAKNLPCPIRPNWNYEHVLRMAIELAGLPDNVVFAPSPEEAE